EGPEQWLARWKPRTAADEGPPPPPPPVDPAELNDLVDRAVHNAMSQHAAARRGTPPDRDSLTDALAELLEEQRRLDPSSALVSIRRGEDPYDLWLVHRDGSGAEVATGLVLATALNARQMAPLLLKLCEDQ